jgi:hypothetical protein
LGVETENNAIVGMIRDTNIDLLGNSNGENDELVRKYKNSCNNSCVRLNNIFTIISSLVSDEVILETLTILHHY